MLFQKAGLRYVSSGTGIAFIFVLLGIKKGRRRHRIVPLNSAEIWVTDPRVWVL